MKNKTQIHTTKRDIKINTLSFIIPIFLLKAVRKEIVSNHCKFFTLPSIPCELTFFSLLKVFFLLLRGFNLRGRLEMVFPREVSKLVSWRDAKT